MSNSTPGKVTKTINGVNKTFTYPLSDNNLYFKKVNDNLNVSEDGINFTDIGGGESRAFSLKLENWTRSNGGTVILRGNYKNKTKLAAKVYPYPYHLKNTVALWIGAVIESEGDTYVNPYEQYLTSVIASETYVTLNFGIHLSIEVHDNGDVFTVGSYDTNENISIYLETELTITGELYNYNSIQISKGFNFSNYNMIVKYNSPHNIASVVDIGSDLTFETPEYFIDYIIVDIVVIPSKEKGNILLYNTYYEGEEKETVPYTIAETDWSALSDKSPFDHKLDIYFQPPRTYDIVELINDNPVLFANYGFAIGEADSSKISIYSIGKPTTSVTLTVIYTKEV